MNPALLSFKIAQILNFIGAGVLAIAAFALDNTAVMLVFALFVAGWAYFLGRIRRGLLEGKYWAWIAGIIVSGMQLFSLAFPLGLMGLIGLLNEPTRRAFNQAPA